MVDQEADVESQVMTVDVSWYLLKEVKVPLTQG